MAKNSKIRQSAKGEDCTARLPGICNFNPETVVLAHLNGGGMAAKQSDIHAAYMCSECHSVLDHHWHRHGMTRQDRDYEHMRAMVETQIKLLEKGLIVIK